jgi:hypothetical protein
MQWLGKHSYSLYLWHWPIVVYATILNVEDPLQRIFVCSVLTLACAAAGFKLLEHPVRASTWLAARPMRSVGLGATLTIAGGVIALGTGQAALRASSHPMQRSLSQSIAEEPVASGSGRNCLIGFTDVAPVKCIFGASDAAKTVVLFGDSHADQWSTPGADARADARGRIDEPGRAEVLG